MQRRAALPATMQHNLRVTVLAAIAAITVACSGSPRGATGPTPMPQDTAAPPLQREIRGLWIATVANIDWPSARSLTTEQQRAEVTDILARAQAAGLNTVVLRVRPAGAAVCPSPLEPWAPLLAGAQGTSPGHDPPAFAIQEAHGRGMQL